MAMVKKCTDNKNRFLKVSWIRNVLEFGSNWFFKKNLKNEM